MRLSDFDYELPQHAIAQTPTEPRDNARLLVLHRAAVAREHRRFSDLPAYLRPGDVLVLNDTRVLPARLKGSRESTGGRVELLLLRRLENDRWEVLARPGRAARPGQWLTFGAGRLRAEVLRAEADGRRVVAFQYDGIFETILDEIGQMPLPPYITAELAEPERYQTVYARQPGAAAAPTAGLHFTPDLLGRLTAGGVQIAYITLHIGLGTFRPVQTEDITSHPMHAEYYQISAATAGLLNTARTRGRRLIPVGTTALRALESASDSAGKISAAAGWTDIFIYPGYRFKAADGLITNFHLPKSTLLMLVMALAGREPILAAYREAISLGYRFFSFGDAMFIV